MDVGPGEGRRAPEGFAIFVRGHAYIVDYGQIYVYACVAQDIITVQDLMGVVEHETIVDLYKLLEKDTVTDALKWEDVFKGYILREFHGFMALERDWMAVIHDGEPSYTFTLADVTNDDALAHFETTQEEMEQYFNICVS